MKNVLHMGTFRIFPCYTSHIQSVTFISDRCVLHSLCDTCAFLMEPFLASSVASHYWVDFVEFGFAFGALGIFSLICNVDSG